MSQTAVTVPSAAPIAPADPGCPVTAEELTTYLRANAADLALGLKPQRLTLVGTRRIEECTYWIWRFDARRRPRYALVMADAEGVWLSWNANDEGLSADEVVRRDHRNLSAE